MPLVTVTMWPGRSDDAKRRIVARITDLFEQEGVPRDSVTVIIYEVPKNHWAESGKLCSD